MGGHPSGAAFAEAGTEGARSTSQAATTPIILFKTPSPDATSDPYTTTLSSVSSSTPTSVPASTSTATTVVPLSLASQTPSSSASSSRTPYNPIYIPVLEETYSVDELLPILEQGADGWEGVVITSRRGAEGWMRAVERVLETNSRSRLRTRSATRSGKGSIRDRKGKGKEQMKYGVSVITNDFTNYTRQYPDGEDCNAQGRSGDEGIDEGTENADSDDSNHHKSDKKESWNLIPLFTVGTASSDHLASANLPAQYVPRIPTYPSGISPPKYAVYLLPIMLSTPPRLRYRAHPTKEELYSAEAEHESTEVETQAEAEAEDHMEEEDRDPSGRYGKYLFVRGDKSMEYLPAQLREVGREVREVVVYATSARGDVDINLEQARSQLAKRANGIRMQEFNDLRTKGVERCPDGKEDESVNGVEIARGSGRTGGWMAFFSPSGAQVVLPYLFGNLDSKEQDEAPTTGDQDCADPAMRQAQREDKDPAPVSDPRSGGTNDKIAALRELEGRWAGWKIACIGETTRRYLEDAHGLKVHAVAENPNPAGLSEAIRAADAV